MAGLFLRLPLALSLYRYQEETDKGHNDHAADAYPAVNKDTKSSFDFFVGVRGDVPCAKKIASDGAWQAVVVEYPEQMEPKSNPETNMN